MTKYGQQQSIARSDTTCIPLVLNTLAFGPIWLKTISIRSPKFQKRCKWKSRETDFRDRWRKQLSVVVQSCNSPVIFKKLSKLSKCNFDDFLYDKDVQHFVP